MISPKNLPPPDDRYPVRKALLSVSDKSHLIPFAHGLADLGVELISTGGTARTLREAGLQVTDVHSITDYPEILDGRVKTLHPRIHSGLLARRNDPADLEQLDSIQAAPIDLVIVNLYPFERATASPETRDEVAVENIDIGGPAMIRAAAKNHFFVGVVTSPNDYDNVLAELREHSGGLSMATRRSLAWKAFSHTARYDQAIAAYFGRPADVHDAEAPAEDQFSLQLPRARNLRYGENPHQTAAFFGNPQEFFEQLHGKELSFNNILDLSAALYLIDEFSDDGPTAAILKHTNPCGVATGGSLEEAYRNAFETDRQSPFGGIVVVNRSLDRATAEAVDEIFTEIIIAPDFERGVLELLQQKRNRRLIRSLQPARTDRMNDVRSVLGGVLGQERDPATPSFADLKSRCKVVTRRQPTTREWHDMLFAWRVVKHVKSNAIVYARNGATIGIGAGQMSRIDSMEIAVQKGHKSGLTFAGSVVASDAFFPFADGLLAAAATGAAAVVQPGGSVRDAEVISAANEHNVAMIFTGRRHFRH